ncbi:MAG: prenyltransferase [Cycloclasticus sp.]|nr:prenyltransferase [Cycloclasticus sp.]MBQ0790513.1 prenyltransferase [Cycloclasticus sp.]
MSLKTVLQTFRPSFLVLTPVCVFLGLSTVLTMQAPINQVMVLLIFIGALFAHISVNTLNEYFDFKSGLDLTTNKTPFSGGSGALPNAPDAARLVLKMGLLSLLITVIVGVYLIMERGLQILPIGLIGMVLIITYTQWINRSPWLCLIAPGLGFGVLMVVGTQLVLTGSYSPLAWLVSLVPFFLVNNLLLLNQYPDIHADARVGRKTFPIVFGVKKSNLVYAGFMLAAYALILFSVLKGYIPTLGLIALAPMVLSLFALYGAVKYAAKIAEAPKYMAANVAATLLTPLLLGVSIVNG